MTRIIVVGSGVIVFLFMFLRCEEKRPTDKKGVSFIFNSESIQNHTKDLKDIYEVMAAYYEAVELSNSLILEDCFHDQWLMRDTDTPNAATLNVEGKQKFIRRVDEHGPYAEYAKGRMITGVDIAYDQLAFVRVNKDTSRSATCFFLFKLADGWKIMDKVWVNPRKTLEVESDSHAIVMRMTQDYFSSISKNNLGLLRELTDSQWDLKYRQKGDLKVLDREQYFNQIQADGPKGFVDISQLLSVQLFQDCMAIVRIDRPTLKETIFLTFIKVGADWKIVSERRAGLDYSVTPKL